MASRARFGRLPRAAPSLTSTIVALAQEYQRVRESNIVDAWKSGGEFEGKKVTDEMVMKWMRARRDELSPDDPKWDYYDNQLTQYEFAIENSKMELKYAKKDVGDTEMASFYHKWAAKLPPDSEAYRQREKLAAQYNERATAGRAGSRRAASDSAYVNAINKSYEKEATYNGQLAFLEEAAHNTGILLGGETLANIDPSGADGARINQLWDDIAHSPEWAYEREFYGRQIRANGNPNFNWETGFSQDAFNAQQRVKKAAVDDRIREARKAGRKADVTAFTKERDGIKFVKQASAGWDETEEYEDARREWESIVRRTDSTPLEKDRANQKYIGELTRIRDQLDKQKGPGGHDDRIGYLNNELRTMDGDETPLEHWGGSVGPGGNQGMEHGVETAAGIRQNRLDLENLNHWTNGQPDYVMVKVHPSGEFAAPDPAQYAAVEWAVVPRNTLPPETTFVTQDDHGDPRSPRVVTAVIAKPIFGAADTPGKNGATKTTQGASPIGYMYTLPDGTQGYKYRSADNRWLYTPDNPFLKTDPATGVKTPYQITSSGDKPAVINIWYCRCATDGWSVTDPEYLKPSTVEVKTRIAKSGYGLWLIGSNPKDRAAYSANTSDIIAMLTLEAGTGPDAEVRLGEMILDADMHRSVYVGNSTEEQQRIRRNALTGSPNPVGLAQAYPGTRTKLTGDNRRDAMTEAGMTAMLTGGGRDQIIEDMREANRLGLKPPEVTGPRAVSPTGGRTERPWTDARKHSLTPPTLPVSTGPKMAPTAMPNVVPGSIAEALTGFFANMHKAPAPSLLPGQRQRQGPIGMVTGIPSAPRPTAPPAGVVNLNPKPVHPPPQSFQTPRATQVVAPKYSTPSAGGANRGKRVPV